MTTYGTIETISQRLAILATNNRGKTLAEYEAEHRRNFQEEAERRETGSMGTSLGTMEQIKNI